MNILESVFRTILEIRSSAAEVSYTEAGHSRGPHPLFRSCGNHMGGGQIGYMLPTASLYPKGGIKVSDNAAYMPIVAVRRLIG